MTLQPLLGLEALWELHAIDRPALRYQPFAPYLKDCLASSSALLETVRTRDVLVHHPYDSFHSVEAFADSSAHDKSVIGIKMTLYRVGSASPIVESLLSAGQDNKQVTAMVELKARFDESNNLIWSRALERAGVHVTYGFQDMKTHCKLCLVIRREQGTIKSYVHVGTGNYNPVTAKQYTDLGYFTVDPDINQDAAELFNFLTGYSKQTTYRKMLVAPYNLREGIIERILREAEFYRQTKKGRIVFKLNSLVDPEVVDALYEANASGVPIDLIVRGICCLRPGVKGLSENIRVISIVGRFLEHSRIYYFANNGEPEALIGSADLMRRNLDRRIEVLIPIIQKDITDHLLTGILEPCLKDNQKAWILKEDGVYTRRTPKPGETEFEVQRYLIGHPSTKAIRLR
jgi:polyphosphate kinase